MKLDTIIKGHYHEYGKLAFDRVSLRRLLLEIRRLIIIKSEYDGFDNITLQSNIDHLMSYLPKGIGIEFQGEKIR